MLRPDLPWLSRSSLINSLMTLTSPGRASIHSTCKERRAHRFCADPKACFSQDEFRKTQFLVGSQRATEKNQPSFRNAHSDAPGAGAENSKPRLAGKDPLVWGRGRHHREQRRNHRLPQQASPYSPFWFQTSGVARGNMGAACFEK